MIYYSSVLFIQNHNPIIMNRFLKEIFSSFSAEEIKKFNDFINSPYFNKKTAVIKFWNELIRHAPEFSSSEITREKIYARIFPGKKYNYGTVKNLIFHLTKLAEQFLSVEKLTKDKFQSDMNYLNQLLYRSLGKIFNIKFKEAEKSNLIPKGFYHEHYYNLSKLTALKKDYQFVQSLKQIDHNDLDKSSEYFICFIIIQIFADYNNSTAFRIMSNKTGAADLLEKFLSCIDLEKMMLAVRETSEEDYHRLLFSYKKYLAISNPNNQQFYFEYKSYLVENLESLTRDEKYNNINGLTTALSKLKLDPQEKMREYNEIYKIRIKNDLVVSKEGLSPVIYSSIIGNMGLSKEPELLREFMDKYYHLLHDDFKSNMMSFSHAYLCFAVNNFHKCLDYLTKIEFDIFQFKINVRNLQMMVYYEIDDYIGFSYIKDSYKHFLFKNKEISSTTKKFNSNLISYIQSMFKIRESKDRIGADELKRKLVNESSVSMKSWLLEKAGELQLTL